MEMDEMKCIEERGFAMPAVMGALVIIGVLGTAGFYMAQQELRIGVATNNTNLAVNIAQAGANEVMANWNGFQLANVLPWEDTTITGTAPGGAWSVNIMNANNYSYLIRSTGTVTRGGALWSGASRTIGIAAKIIYANINPPGALTTRGDVTVTGSAIVDGNSATPTGWDPYCTTVPTDPAAGVVTDAGGSVTQSGSGYIDGTPASTQDPTIVDETFEDFGNLTWDELVAIAQIEGKDITGLGSTITNTVPVLNADGECDMTVLTNWGDPQNPTNPCGAYFPLIYHSSTGTVAINSSAYGQGILLIEGDLRIQGGYNFFGIIITQGTFRTAGSGGTITGAVLAGNDLILDQTTTGNSDIIYSRCAVTRAVLNNANLSRARPLAQRSWVDLSSALN